MRKSLYVLITSALFFIGLISGVFIGKNTASTQIVLNPSSGNSSSSSASQKDPDNLGKVNINIATKDILILLPGIGEAKAARIIQFREEYGRFTSVDDLIYIDGFSYTTIEELRPYITVGG